METTLTDTLETRSDSEPLSVKVVRKVARMEGVDPTELDAPLYDERKQSRIVFLIQTGARF
ncbi:hypothetical protein EL22_28670 [Halostagnicola sp. A56]|uniref:HalOD1 output domain-containing protein n=1 Tax=Halostagnicola sp. A56 TaxID=1495067 RepID=UPI00065F69FB|nr:HalOD1 output domain-containing protein [Halostagnicola sp. A56]KMT45707.1 hypothetical protein EL22_28670 [Halostagnicola sp. A56]